MNRRLPRVAITGIGIVSPLGLDTDSTWRALCEGQSGVAGITKFDAAAFSTRIAAEVKGFKPDLVKNKKLLKKSLSFTQFALQASEQALLDAGIRPTHSDSERWGMIVGSGMQVAQYPYWQAFQKQFAADGNVDIANLMTTGDDFFTVDDFAKTLTNSGLSLLLQSHQIHGYATAVHTACASGGQALGLALQAIRRGDSDVVLAGGYDSMIDPFGLSSFCLLGALSDDNDDPTRASRPFDLTRNGFVLGEGAAFLVLESWDRAVARGAKIYAELAGEGNSISAYRITDSHPSGDGAIQAMQIAMQDANLQAMEIDYINAHGTSTKMNDYTESQAIKAVFGDKAKDIPVSSSKSLTGHLIAAAGALEGALCALAIHHQQMPMNANLQTLDPDCDLHFVTSPVADCRLGAVMSNCFGFGGTNSSLVFRHPDAEVR